MQCNAGFLIFKESVFFVLLVHKARVGKNSLRIFIWTLLETRGRAVPEFSAVQVTVVATSTRTASLAVSPSLLSGSTSLSAPPTQNTKRGGGFPPACYTI